MSQNLTALLAACAAGGAVGLRAGLRRKRRGMALYGWRGYDEEEKPEWLMEASDKETLRQVVIVHRHGTRFPTKPPGAGNLSWPQRAHFWESYKGHLTPVGAKQLQDAGTVLRQRYIGNDGGLFKGVLRMDGRVIAVYTSNIQRTLQSAWSFLIGFVPRASIFFAFRSERVFSQALKQSVGVPIYVEDATEGDDKLFHEWKIKKKMYKAWKKENQQRSEFLMKAKDDPKYIALLDKLYELTGEAKLKPGIDPLTRLTGAKDVDTQVMIDEAHGRPALPTDHGEALTHEEKQLLRSIGDEVKRCWFGDANGDLSNSYGKKGASYLAHKIWRHMNERAEALCHLRFVQFSCHDTTMAALAAHLGIELDEIGFGAFFIFELHKAPDGGRIVKFYYNSHPADGACSYKDLRSVALPLGTGERLVPLKECPTGSVCLSALKSHCQIPDVEEIFEKFTKLLGRADISPTRKALEDLLKDGKHGWLTFDEWKDKHHEEFVSFDKNNDGQLCKPEMEEAFKYWYGLVGKTIDLVFHLVDREPATDMLTEEDVYLAMCALVGVRGSISAKTVGSVLLEGTDDVLGDVDARSSGGTTKLMVAVNTGDFQRTKELIARGANVNLTDDYGWSPLRYGVRRKDFALVNALIEMGADVNLASKSGRTPLMSAVMKDISNIVQLLVEKGANRSAKNADGLTAYDIASRGGGMGSSIVRGLVKP